MKKDPAYRSYLWGTFSNTERALPVPSLNVKAQSQTVTFQIVPKSSITQKPLWFMAGLRPHITILIFIPLLVQSFLAFFAGRLEAPYFLLAILGLTFGATSVSFQNEVADHVQGADWLHRESGRGLIKNGVITARLAQKISWFFASLSLLVGLVSVIFRPEVIIVILTSFGLVVMAQFLSKRSFKNSLLAEFSMALALGPLLWIGLDRLLAVNDLSRTFAFGMNWAMIALWIIGLRNWRDLMATKTSGYRSLIHLLGFEKSKNYLFYLSNIVFVSSVLLTQKLFAPINLQIVCGFAVSIFIFYFLGLLKSCQSPAGSEAVRVYKAGYRAVLIVCLHWVTQALVAFVLYLGPQK